MEKSIGIMQPFFLPWIGYFEMIDASDIFILLDDVQFAKRSWHQRNKIKGANDIIWLTVPVHSKSKRFQKIKDVSINNQATFQIQDCQYLQTRLYCYEVFDMLYHH